jgi:hypothetical protein
MTTEPVSLQAIFDIAPLVIDAAFAIVAVASAVAALTPTPRDDDFWGRAYGVLEILALNIGRAKQVPPNRVGGRFAPN